MLDILLKELEAGVCALVQEIIEKAVDKGVPLVAS